MTDIVERAKEALEGVTEGPWNAINVGNIHWGVSHRGNNFPTVVKAECGYDGYGSGSSQANAEFIAAARTLVPELVAELERLHSWDGLMELLDEHWPEDIFPTQPDTDKRDPGPRIVSLLRMVDRINEQQYQVVCDQWAEANRRLNAEMEGLRSDVERLRGVVEAEDGPAEGVGRG